MICDYWVDVTSQLRVIVVRDVSYHYTHHHQHEEEFVYVLKCKSFMSLHHLLLPPVYVVGK